jgi:hypothetical protein
MTKDEAELAALQEDFPEFTFSLVRVVRDRALVRFEAVRARGHGDLYAVIGTSAEVAAELGRAA